MVDLEVGERCIKGKFDIGGESGEFQHDLMTTATLLPIEKNTCSSLVGSLYLLHPDSRT